MKSPARANFFLGPEGNPTRRRWRKSPAAAKRSAPGEHVHPPGGRGPPAEAQDAAEDDPRGPGDLPRRAARQPGRLGLRRRIAAPRRLRDHETRLRGHLRLHTLANPCASGQERWPFHYDDDKR